ncbi:MAG: carboxypeptidase-like regulatory domain-containing protein [Candidatus Bathyarchaeia archaeon]
MKILLLLLLTVLAVHPFHVTAPAKAEASASPSKDWGVFFDTSGPIMVNITEPGVAVRLEVPQEFIGWRGENDTWFIKSDISDDYYYYKLIRPKSRFPHELNAPYTVEVWHPPAFLGPGCVRTWINFTPPRYILLEDLTAPSIAGIYNISVYIAPNMGKGETPNFPSKPSKVVQVPVSMREDQGRIVGRIVDGMDGTPIRAKGVVFAYHDSRVVARAYVDPATGNFNLTGLYEGVYDIVASAGYFPPQDTPMPQQP